MPGLRILTDNVGTLLSLQQSNGIPSSGYHLNRIVHLPIRKSGTLHGLCFWFRLNMLPATVVPGDIEECIDTIDENNHYRQAAFLLENQQRVDVRPGEELEVELSVDEASGLFCRLLDIVQVPGSS